MNAELRPEEAADALAEIEQRRQQVMRLLSIPAWFWWANAVLIVSLSAAIESRRPLLLGIGIVVFTLGILATVLVFVLGSMRHAQPRNDLMPPAGVFAILGFVALVLAVTLPTSFALDAAGMRYPATIGSLIGGGMLVLGGPLLERYLHRIMRAKMSGGAR